MNSDKLDTIIEVIATEADTDALWQIAGAVAEAYGARWGEEYRGVLHMDNADMLKGSCEHMGECMAATAVDTYKENTNSNK